MNHRAHRPYTWRTHRRRPWVRAVLVRELAEGMLRAAAEGAPWARAWLDGARGAEVCAAAGLDVDALREGIRRQARFAPRGRAIGRAVALLKAGASVRDAALRTGVSPATVARRAARAAEGTPLLEVGMQAGAA